MTDIFSYFDYISIQRDDDTDSACNTRPPGLFSALRGIGIAGNVKEIL